MTRNITPAALVVVTVLGLCTLWLAYVTGTLYLRGDQDGAKDAAIQFAALSAVLVGVLAKTGNSPSPEPGQTTVTTDIGTPVTTGTPVTVGEPVPAEAAPLAFDEQP